MKPSLSIDTLSIGVPVEHPRRGRRPQPVEVIDIELSNSGLCLWDEWHQMCRESFTFAPSRDPRIATNVSEMPHIDEVYRFIAQQRVTHRSDLIGAFLEPAVIAMENAIAARDGSSVYFAYTGGHVKIGYSKRVSARLGQLQTGCATPIQLLGTMPGGLAVERRVHRQFDHLRLDGEWFVAHPDLMAYIREVTGSSVDHAVGAAP